MTNRKYSRADTGSFLSSLRRAFSLSKVLPLVVLACLVFASAPGVAHAVFHSAAEHSHSGGKSCCHLNNSSDQHSVKAVLLPTAVQRRAATADIGPSPVSVFFQPLFYATGQRLRARLSAPGVFSSGLPLQDPVPQLANIPPPLFIS
ncbi:MAG: hypothetical protein ACYC2I_10045 [Elusimicrobiales bacterium]